MHTNRRPVLRTLAAVGALTATIGLAACGTDDTASNIFVIPTATANEPVPGGTAAFDDVLRDAVGEGDGKLQILLPHNGTVTAQPPIDMVVMRNGEPEQDPAELDRGLKPIAAGIDKALAETASNAGTLDLLAGFNDAAHRAGHSTIIAMSSGLQTQGLADFRGLGWDFDNSAVITSLANQGFLPDLDGKKVRFVGLGQTAGAQQPLPEPMRRKVTQFWIDLCKAAKADACEAVPDNAAPQPARSTTPAATVKVPSFSLPALTSSTKQIVVDSSALFAPDSAELLPGVADTMSQLAGQLSATGVPVRLTGHTWKVGPADGARQLSTQRAQAVADALIAGGLPPSRVAQVRGVGYDELITPTGADPAETAAANRVVVIGLDR